jgi:ABC-type spermidine/putrescine transport system permease subunit II
VIKRTGEAFIDDTTLWLLKLGLYLPLIVTMMQSMAQRWEKLLYATGGALNRAKCYWYGISWHFTDTGNPTIVTDPDPDMTIQLTSGSNPNPLPIQ